MATPMFGGDEVNAVVVDVGSSQCKAGYAGEDMPKAVFGTALGEMPEAHRAAAMEVDAPKAPEGQEGDKRVPPEFKRRGFSVLTSAHTRPLDHQEVLQTFSKGEVTDWELWEHVVDEALSNRLRASPEEHPVVLSEPVFNSRDAREKMVQCMFEDLNVPAVFLAKNAVLSSFALGRQTSLVVDMGHEGTVVSAVHDGYVLNASVTRSPVGGSLLNESLLASLRDKGSAVHPRYMYAKIDKTGVGMADNVLTDVPGVTPSHRAWAVAQIVADIKESHCRVSEVPFSEDENLNMPVQTYELPDGSTVDIGVERFKIPEILFNPEVLSTIKSLPAVSNYDGTPLKSVQEMVIDCVNKTDVDVRRDMFGGVVLTGGTSLFTSTKERLEKELLELVPASAKVKVATHQNAAERKFSVWLGGSILGSLGSFHQLWMSKSEYAEHGAALIHRKSP